MNSIKQNVMASVRVIYWGRKAASPMAVKLYILAASLLALRELTYLRQVVRNMFDVTSVSGFFHFMESALTHTHLSVLAVLFVIAVVAVLFLRDALRRPSFRAATA